MKSKKRQPSSASDVLQRLLESKNSPLSEGFQRWKLEHQWEDVVGATIGSNTRPVFFDKGILLVEVKTSSWMNEVRFFQSEMIQKINDHMGKHWVYKLRFIHK